MNQAPAEDDDEAYVFIDHREDEIAIAEAVSARLPAEHALQAHEGEETISIVFQGQSHAVPLQFSPHDRYVMISSLAHLLREEYRFFVLKPSLHGDTHGLLVVPLREFHAWSDVPDHLVPLDLGYDYFHQIRVPYLGGEDSAPQFEADRQRVEHSFSAMEGYMQSLFAGEMTEDMATKIAAAVLNDPDSDDVAQGRSEAEVVAEIRKAFKEAFESPEAVESRRELEEARAALRALVGEPPKPS